MTKYASECIGGSKNPCDRACDEIRMETQTENFLGSLISTRLPPLPNKESLSEESLNIFHKFSTFIASTFCICHYLVYFS